MSSGSSWVSKSMQASAISAQVSSRAPRPAALAPKRHTAAALSAAAASSTSG